jgi:integrase/recombinase XerD
MKINEAVQIYVEQKRLTGVDFTQGFRSLRSFSVASGNIALADVNESHVTSYLNGPLTSTVTWRNKYGLLKHFFLYWTARDEVSIPPLPLPRAAVAQTFIPYIYSRAEVRRLLSAVNVSQQNEACKIDPKTFRTLLTFLYATGALVGEGRRLQRKDVDLRRKRISIRSSRTNRSRNIPIGRDLCSVLKRYQDVKHGNNPDKNIPFFVSVDGTSLNGVTVAKSFQRLRGIANVLRESDSLYQPRIHDLRHTFAVHRITSWLRHGADMNRMMPALAAYLGQVGLDSTGRYLKLSQDRFKTQLSILCRTKTKKHWRDNAALMRFVDAL